MTRHARPCRSPSYDAENPLDHFVRPAVTGLRCWAANVTADLENPLTGEAMPLDVWAARIGIAPAALHDRLCRAPTAVALHACSRERTRAVRRELERLLA